MGIWGCFLYFFSLVVGGGLELEGLELEGLELEGLEGMKKSDKDLMFGWMGDVCL